MNRTLTYLKNANMSLPRSMQGKIIFGLIALIASKILTIAVPFIFKYAVDILDTAQTEPHELTVLIFTLGPLSILLGYGTARLGTVILNAIRDVFFAEAAQRLMRQMAGRTFTHLHDLSLRFHLERRTGALSRVIDRGTKSVEMMIRMVMSNAIPTILEVVLVFAALAIAFDWRYVLVVIIIVFAYTFYSIKASEWRLNIRRTMNTADQDANAKAIDSLLNYETVKYFNNESREFARFDTAMQSFEKASVKVYTSLSLLNVGQAAIIAIGITTLMIFTTLSILDGTKTLGDLVMVNALMVQLSIPLNFLGTFYREIRQAMVDIEDMLELQNHDLEITDAPNAKQLEIEDAHVRFKDVHFSYNPDRDILKGVSFEIPAGQTVAVVGPTGAGKSTLSRILYRFYDITSGTVEIDGQDIRSVTQDSLRRAIGIVPQDTVLFNDTIGYNILYGNPDATQQDLEKAAELAQIDAFIKSLPEGYNTLVGERGLKLSGGEKQRVAIARSILKNPQILILDEATSALDTTTERDIQAALRNVAKNRTTLVIAHRLSTIIDADHIIVLKEGRIQESGTHDSLLKSGGLYAKLWAQQLTVDPEPISR